MRFLLKYYSVPNKRVGWNKRDGRKKSQNLINVLDGKNVMVGTFCENLYT